MIPLGSWWSIWKEWISWVYEGNIFLLRVYTLLFVNFVLVMLCVECDQYLAFLDFLDNVIYECECNADFCAPSVHR